jgi:hypothetical protein
MKLSIFFIFVFVTLAYGQIPPPPIPNADVQNIFGFVNGLMGQAANTAKGKFLY